MRFFDYYLLFVILLFLTISLINYFLTIKLSYIAQYSIRVHNTSKLIATLFKRIFNKELFKLLMFAKHQTVDVMTKPLG